MFAHHGGVGHIGVLAKRGERRCMEQWRATAEYLSEKVPGAKFEIVPLEFDEVSAAVKNETVDFLLVNSALYVEMEVLFRVSRIATMRNLILGRGYTWFGGVMFTRADSPIASLQGLEDKRIAAVDKASLGGWLLAIDELKCTLGLDESDFSELRFLGSHDAVVKAVLNGDADAGVVRTDTLERMHEEGAIDIHELKPLKHALGTKDIQAHQHYVHFTSQQGLESFPFFISTELYPEWPMAKLMHTSDDLSSKVAAALLEMPATSEAARAARIAGWTVPMNYQSVHELLKFNRIGPYAHYGETTLLEAISQHKTEVGVTIVLLLVISWFALYSHKLALGLKRSRAQVREELNARVAEEVRRKDVENMVTHELRSPLVSIYNGLMCMANDKITEEHRRTALQSSMKKTKNMLRVISLSKALAMMETGNFSPVREYVSVAPLLNRVVQDVGELAEVKNISVRFIAGDNGHGGVQVMGEELLFETVFTNLIRNAVEASPGSETVTVDLRPGSKLMIRVKNKGAVPESIRESFFDKYITHGKPSGTGLGTYTAKTIVENHGGNIFMTTSEGMGTEICVELPGVG